MTHCENHLFVEFFCLKIDFKGSEIFKNYTRITIATLLLQQNVSKLAKQPGQNITRLCKNLHGLGVYMSPYKIGTMPVKKLT